MALNERELIGFLEEEIPLLAKNDTVMHYLDDVIYDERQDRKDKTFSNLVNFILDSFDALAAARRAPRRGDEFKAAIDIATYFGAALMLEDRTVRIDSRDRRDLESLARSAEDLESMVLQFKDEMERDRGGRRGYREESRRDNRYSSRGSNRYDDRQSYRDDRGGNNYYEPRQSRESNRYDRYESRYQSNSRRNNDRPNTGERMPSRQNPIVEARLRQQQQREEERFQSRHEREDDRYTARRPRTNAEASMPDPRQVNNPSRAYERVEPNDIKRPASWNTGEVSSQGNLLPPKDHVLTQDDVNSNRFVLSDQEVFMRIAVDPKIAKRKVGIMCWEADQVTPQWRINDSGYREYFFNEMNTEEKDEMDRKLHELPILSREYGESRTHPQNNRIRSALGTARFNVEATRKVREEDKAEYDRVVGEIQAENESLSDEEKKPLPEVLEVAPLPSFDTVMSTKDELKAFGQGHLRMKALSKISSQTNDMLGAVNSKTVAYQVYGKSYEPIWLASDEREAENIINDLALTGYLIRDNARITMLQDLFDTFKQVEGKIPAPLVSAVKRHTVKLVNSILALEMGSDLAIDAFEDIRTLYDDIVAAEGQEFATKLGKALQAQMANFQMFTKGSGMSEVDEGVDARTIYIVSRVNMVVAPLLAKDLKLRLGAKENKEEAFFVSQHATPVLWKAVASLGMNSKDDKACRQLLWLADNSWLEVRRDFQDPESNGYIVQFKESVE